MVLFPIYQRRPSTPLLKIPAFVRVFLGKPGFPRVKTSFFSRGSTSYPEKRRVLGVGGIFSKRSPAVQSVAPRGHCFKGEECTYAHGEEDLRSFPRAPWLTPFHPPPPAQLTPSLDPAGSLSPGVHGCCWARHFTFLLIVV